VAGMVPDGTSGVGSLTRRAPFSANPNVGPRGQRTRQRIFDAALQVLREDGYQKFSVDRIARLAGCSRIAFYQYFSGSQEVLGHLADEVTRQAGASVETLQPVTPDAAGWQAMRDWVTQQADIYAQHEPVFRALDAAAGRGSELAVAREAAGRRISDCVRDRLPPLLLPEPELATMISLLLGLMTRTFPIAALLDAAAVDTGEPGPYSKDRVHDALTDVMHRTLFGVLPDINTHQCDETDPVPIEFGPFTTELLAQGDPTQALSDNARSTVTTLLDSGRAVLVDRGYHGTRVDDIVTAAGMSHGVFYRYFKNKNEFVRVLVLHATRPLADALASLDAVDPDSPTADTDLREWLGRYHATQVKEAGLIRVWAEASAYGPLLGAAAAPALDHTRRQLANFLHHRDLGNRQVEAVVMLAVLEAFGDRHRSPLAFDAVMDILQRGLLGR
jgi:AcrR family transcriptional regulator